MDHLSDSLYLALRAPVSHASWMVERLNEETRTHQGAEAAFDVLFEPVTSSADYQGFLVRAYGFEAPLEATLMMTPNLELMIDLAPRTKAGFLAADLIALGLRPQDVAEIPHCLAIPQFRGAAEALGWMYVVERTTLAHCVVRRHLLTRLPREIRTASAYLSCYTGIMGIRWRELGATLDEVAGHPAIADRIVAAAGEAFRCRRRWIRQDLQDTRAAI